MLIQQVACQRRFKVIKAIIRLLSKLKKTLLLRLRVRFLVKIPTPDTAPAPAKIADTGRSHSGSVTSGLCETVAVNSVPELSK